MGIHSWCKIVNWYYEVIFHSISIFLFVSAFFELGMINHILYFSLLISILTFLFPLRFSLSRNEYMKKPQKRALTSSICRFLQFTNLIHDLKKPQKEHLYHAFCNFLLFTPYFSSWSEATQKCFQTQNAYLKEVWEANLWLRKI